MRTFGIAAPRRNSNRAPSEYKSRELVYTVFSTWFLSVSVTIPSGINSVALVPSDRRLSTKLMPTFAEYRVISAADPHDR
jgi:hypothetical protein